MESKYRGVVRQMECHKDTETRRKHKATPVVNLSVIVAKSKRAEVCKMIQNRLISS